MAYDNRLSGALFKNDRKTASNQPDYRGSITDEDGKEYWASAWIKEPRGGGNKYLSIALTVKDDNQGVSGQRQQRPNNDADDFLAQNRGKADAHRASLSDRKGDMAGGPGRPAADFDSFDDDIPF